MKRAAKRSCSSGSRNPLFIQWLSEWKEDAARKELRSQYTYAKAIRSLEKYPLTVYSGKDCKLLEGFGDKLCQTLESRLQKYLEELGTNQGAVEVINEHRDALNLLSNRGKNTFGDPSKKKAKRSHTVTAESTRTVVQHRIHSESNQKYVPRPGTGAYALLVTLIIYEKDSERSDGLSKKELMRMAQPLAEKSFTIPDPGSRYTAWSSMGTLIKKQLVNKQSNPAKYSLTEAGRILADQLQNKNSPNDTSLCQSQKSATIPADNYCEINKMINIAARNSDNVGMSEGTNARTSSVSVVNMQSSLGDSSSKYFTGLREKRFLFCYLSDADVEHQCKDSAAVTVDDELGIGFLIKAKYDDLLTCALRYKLDFSRLSGDDFVRAYLHDSDAPDVAPGLCPGVSALDKRLLEQSSNTASTTMAMSSNSSIESSKTSESFKLPVVASKSDINLNHHTNVVSSLTNSNNVCVKEKKKVKRVAADAKTKLDKVTQMTEASTGSSARSLCPRPVSSTSSSTISSTISSTSSSTSTSTNSSTNGFTSNSTTHDLVEAERDSVDLCQPDFVLVPGSFDVILCVDNHEIKAGSKVANQDQLIRELNKNSVMYEIRPLQVGDFLWIAKARNSSVSNGVSTDSSGGRELVLEHIIERKRMDDLASSIMDGRYREQKHRMRSCGLRCPTYLVEMYGSIQNFTISEDSLSQAIINTRVVDEFFVKRTRDTRESAEYLTLMTRHLQRVYSSKTLYGFNKHFKWSQCSSASSRNEAYLMSYDVFNASSMKTRPLTVRETFAKNLMQINGVTAEKVGAIVKQFATPSILIDAYKNCSNDKSRHVLLTDLKFGSNKRSLGPLLSKTIALMYWTCGKHS